MDGGDLASIRSPSELFFIYRNLGGSDPDFGIWFGASFQGQGTACVGTVVQPPPTVAPTPHPSARLLLLAGVRKLRYSQAVNPNPRLHPEVKQLQGRRRRRRRASNISPDAEVRLVAAAVGSPTLWLVIRGTLLPLLNSSMPLRAALSGRQRLAAAWRLSAVCAWRAQLAQPGGASDKAAAWKGTRHGRLSRPRCLSSEPWPSGRPAASSSRPLSISASSSLRVLALVALTGSRASGLMCTAPSEHASRVSGQCSRW